MTTEQMTGLVTQAQPQIAGDEGKRRIAYKDSLGVPTIGIGINLLEKDVPQLCAQCGADYVALLKGSAALTDSQIEFLYEQKAIGTIEWLTSIFPAFFTYTLPRQIALLDMSYNLGEPRFRGFKMMISAILQGDWLEAGAQAIDSIWHTQVGARADRIKTMLQDG